MVSKKDIQKLIRQSARWSLAASQDESPVVAVLHANYAVGYLWALKEIATENQINDAMGPEFNIRLFVEKLIESQDKATKHVAKLCPKYRGKADPFIAAVAGEG